MVFDREVKGLIRICQLFSLSACVERLNSANEHPAEMTQDGKYRHFDNVLPPGMPRSRKPPPEKVAFHQSPEIPNLKKNDPDNFNKDNVDTFTNYNPLKTCGQKTPVYGGTIKAYNQNFGVFDSF